MSRNILYFIFRWTARLPVNSSLLPCQSLVG